MTEHPLGPGMRFENCRRRDKIRNIKTIHEKDAVNSTNTLKLVTKTLTPSRVTN